VTDSRSPPSSPGRCRRLHRGGDLDAGERGTTNELRSRATRSHPDRDQLAISYLYFFSTSSLRPPERCEKAGWKANKQLSAACPKRANPEQPGGGGGSQVITSWEGPPSCSRGREVQSAPVKLVGQQAGGFPLFGRAPDPGGSHRNRWRKVVGLPPGRFLPGRGGQPRSDRDVTGFPGRPRTAKWDGGGHLPRHHLHHEPGPGNPRRDRQAIPRPRPRCRTRQRERAKRG
jgi:hypothetical protein